MSNELGAPPLMAPLTALHLPGGGARGAYQVGTLKALAELTASHSEPPFKIYTGTSAGAINAAVMASHADRFAHGVDRLSLFWAGMRCHHIYRTGWPNVLSSALRWLAGIVFGRFGVKPPSALLDTTPLRQLLQRETQLQKIGTLIQQGHLESVALSASGYTTGSSVTFFDASNRAEWRSGRRLGRHQAIDVDHLMASTALPLLFPPVAIGHEYYGDGSLRQTAPLSPAIHLGADRILVVSARDERQDSEPQHTGPRPSPGTIAGHMLDIVFMDNLEADLERVNRINQTLNLVPASDQKKTRLRPIDTLVLRPSIDLRSVVRQHVSAMPSSVKTLLAGIGAWGSDLRLASYLLFESGYCQALIDLGYRDAMDQRDTLMGFLAADPTDPH